MAYVVLLTSSAQADLVQLDNTVRYRLLDKLKWMGDNVELLRHEALQGDEWRGCYRYRVGDYRIIYCLQQATDRLVILRVVHRREAYR